MTGKLLTVLKIAVVVLLVLALLMGGWLIYSRFFANKNKGKVETTNTEVNLKWWVLWENETDMQYLADLYTAEHPDVKITIETQLENQYRDKLTEQMSDGLSETGPDIARIHNTWVPLLSQYLSPLPVTVMSESDYASTFYDTALTDFKAKDGNIYAIPLMFDGLGVYYNKDLLNAAGYTVPEDNWDDFVQQAISLTEYDSNNNILIAGAGIGASSNIDFAFDIASLLMLQQGATIVDSSGKTTFGSDTEMNAAKALKFYTDFVLRYKIWDRTLPKDITMFSEGRLAMMFAPSWRVFDIKNAVASYDAVLDFDISPVPQLPSEGGSEVNWATYWGEAVSAESEHPDVAWDFLKFISEKEQLEAFYNKLSSERDFGEIYPRKDMADELIGNQYVGAYIKMADTARIWRMVDSDRVGTTFNDLIDEIVGGGDNSVSSIQGKLTSAATVIDQIIAGK